MLVFLSFPTILVYFYYVLRLDVLAIRGVAIRSISYPTILFLSASQRKEMKYVLLLIRTVSEQAAELSEFVPTEEKQNQK